MGSASQACDLLKSGKTWTIITPGQGCRNRGFRGGKIVQLPEFRSTNCYNKLAPSPRFLDLSTVLPTCRVTLATSVTAMQYYVVRDAKLHRGSVT